jgi:enolase
MKDIIENVWARQVLDSRGQPTVEVEVHCQGGAQGRAMVPSGASTGRHEAVELRDGDPAPYQGKSVRRAVAHVNDVLGPKLVGQSTGAQRDIDRQLLELDGTPNKGRLGANALLGVSLACAHAAAAARGQALWAYLNETVLGGACTARMPMPMVNMISGGLHAGRNLDFQDFLLLPIGARSYSEALEMTVAVYRALAEILKKAGLESVLVGDEGGFGPRLPSNQAALDSLMEAFARLGLQPGRDAGIALDVASTHFFHGDHYHLEGVKLTTEEMVERLEKLSAGYPILSIEDGLAEDDWDGWALLSQRLGQRVQLIGDDLFVTNLARLERGIAAKVGNAVLIKVNQAGTLTETLDVMARAQQSGYRCIVSARSGETEDSTIADLAVACGAGQIKIGSVARSERLAKYNQLLRIEEAGLPFAMWQTM